MAKNKVKQYRTKKGLTLLQLASMTGISASDISQVENSKRAAYPGWRKRLSEALGVEEEVLFPKEVGK